MTSDQLQARWKLAAAAGREAAAITLTYFGRVDLAVEQKSDASPVTIADREAELHLRKRIAADFPDDGILGEEFGEQPGRSGFRWILDPIDGTKSFIHGVPLYGTMLGIEYEQRSVIGVVILPGLNEWVSAAEGQGCWYVRGDDPPRRAHVSTVPRLAESLFCTTAIEGFDKTKRRPAFEQIQRASQLTRTWGDVYGYVLVATGRAEVMVDPAMNVWDCAALQPILEEAGGTFTDWQGTRTIFSGDAVATNGRVLEEVLACTRAPQ